MKEGIARHVYAKIAFPLFRRLLRVNPLILYYHVVSDHEIPHLRNLYTFRDTSQFKNDLAVLQRFFKPLALQDFLSTFEETHSSTDSFMLTFDDGLKQCYEVVAPILNAKGIPAIFFICSAFVDNKEMAYDHKKSLLSGLVRSERSSPAQMKEVRALLEGVSIVEPSLATGLLCVDYRRRKVLDRIALVLNFDFDGYLKSVQPYLRSEQVNELLKMGHAVGAHSIDHPRYSDLSLAEQIDQTRKSVGYVRERFRLDYGAFSFPHSDANVSKEFFRQIFKNDEVNVCFGNQGLLQDEIPRNLQRSSMEKTQMSAKAILGKSLARRFLKAASGQLTVKRW